MPPLKSIAIPIKKKAAPKASSKKAAALRAQNRADSVIPVEIHRAPVPIMAQPTHRYRVGERLTMTNGGRTLSRVASSCVVIARLPYEGRGHLFYRVRSETEQFERVVAEMDLGRPQSESLE
jgi:hypothetical protein